MYGDRIGRVLTSLILIGATGCAPVTFRPTELPEPVVPAAATCAEAIGSVDEAVVEAGVSDGMNARITGFPHLRVNRFLASYAQDDLNEAQFQAWVRRMANLALKSYEFETANLPAEDKDRLVRRLRALAPDFTSPMKALTDCTGKLVELDMTAPSRQRQLREAARMPDEYLTWQRVVGLYWITQLPFASGVEDWHESVRQAFARPVSALPVRGSLVHYAPPPSVHRVDVRAVLARSRDNPLMIPDPHGHDRDALFRAFAPAFVIDTAGDWDRPGRLGWNGSEFASVRPGEPIAYTRISHTRYRGQALLQLSYVIWFTERPTGAGWDILGGHLDGVIWRVTLSPEGEVLIYDTIHQCGCYHQFFPTPLASLKPRADTLEESAFVPQTLPRVSPDTPLSLRLASGTHYINRVIVGEPFPRAAVTYRFEDDDALRSVPDSGGRSRSVFQPDGIVAGSERAERYFFWPMGVPEPGAMRVWGRHATAFIGRRQFDDADIVARDFELSVK